MKKGWSNNGEHYLGKRRLYGFLDQDLSEIKFDKSDFVFTAEDLGDEINSLLHRNARTFQNLELATADNTAVNPRFANLVTQFLQF